MSDFSCEDLLELKEIFVGGELQRPQKSRIIPVLEPFLDISGPGVTPGNEGFKLDFGSVSPLDIKQKSVFVANLTQQPVMVWVKETETGTREGISAQWQNNSSEILLNPSGGTAELQVNFNGSIVKDQFIDKSIVLVAEMESGVTKEFSLQVRIHTYINFPYGEFDFNGTKRPIPHDFGTIDPIRKDSTAVNRYRLAIKNVGKEKLTFSLQQLPKWLMVEVDELAVDNPAEEFDVEVDMDTIVNFYPLPSMDFLGNQSSDIRLESNDIRPAYRNIDLQFSLTQEIEGSYITWEEPPQLEVILGGTREFKIPLMNWGNRQARISPGNKSNPVTINEEIIIPMAEAGKPIRKELPAVINCEHLPPGNQQMELEILIADSKQEKLKVPIDVSVIDIEANPGTVDFGLVELDQERTVTVNFKATDARDINIFARPVNDLKDYLRVIVADSNSIEVSFYCKIGDIKSVLSSYEGPGIDAQQPEMGYHSTLPVKFQIAKPGIEIDPRHIEGEAAGGKKIAKPITIRNKGNGILKVDIRPRDKFIVIEEKELVIEPNQEKEVLLVLDLSQVTGSSLETSLDLVTNIPGSSPYTVNINLNIKQFAGKLCKNCHLVSDEEHSYCALCGADIRGAEPVSEDKVVTCPGCKRKYYQVLKFCPVDGKQLEKI
jgi:hypothetical protein